MSGIWKKSKPLLILLLVMLIAYLPLSTFIFGMKNDAFSDNFPQKFFLSECLHTGVNPFWNPYMNFGYPAYADFGFAFYNPIVWMFAAIGYNAYTLTLEVLLYIYLGGVSMYYLGKYFSFSVVVSVAVAAMYMCSGFYVGAIQHINSLAAAAFLPLLLLFTLRLLKKPCYQNSFLLSLAAYMVLAGGHPAMPIAAAYYLLVFLVFYAIIQYKKSHHRLRNIVLYLTITVLLLIIYTLPLLHAYFDILPEYERYVKEVPYDATASTHFSNLISLFFPFATASHSSVFTNDVSFRNFYFSLVGCIAVFFSYNQKNKYFLPLLCSGIFLFILSLGDPAKAFFYNHLPLLKNVRTNGHFRVFTLLSFCSLSGFGLQKILQYHSHFQVKLKRFFIVLLMLCISAAIAIVFSRSGALSVFISQLTQTASSTQKIKIFYELLSLPIALLVSLCIAIGCLLLLIFRKQYSARIVVLIVIFDLMVNSIVYLPVTGVGTTTLKQIEAVYKASPAGIPIPSFTSVSKIDTLPDAVTGLTGSLSYYNKKIGTTKLTDYPSYFTSTENYFKSEDTVIVNRQPYLFFKSGILVSNSKNNNIHVNQFSSTKIVIEVNALQNDTLVYLQNNYKYWQATVNGQPASIQTAYHTFQSVAVPKGKNLVIFSYADKILNWLCYASLLGFILAFWLFVKVKRKIVNERTI